MYNHILVALDGSDLAEQVLAYVKPLVEKFGSDVTLLRATTSPEQILAAGGSASLSAADMVIDPMPIVEAEQEDTAAYLSAVAEQLRHENAQVRFVEPEGDAGEAILDYARANGIDLIALTTHGRTGLGRLIFGSVAEHVVQHAPCPVLLVRIHEDKQPAS
jgi:nucleotide-binding universal stress UspA family protein